MEKENEEGSTGEIEMINSFPSYPVWIGKGIYKVFKVGVTDFYNKVKEVCEVFYFMIRGIIIGFYIINSALFGHEDKRIKQHGWTLKGMKQTALFFWLIVVGWSVVLFQSFYGIIFFFVFAVAIGSYAVYSDQKEEFYKKLLPSDGKS
jgi:hypothetical protein